MGVQVNAALIQVRNTAAVVVTANMPAFAQPGVRIDINVAAIGDATNLQGGLLLMTALKGANGVIYAVAQGAVVTEGFATGRSGAIAQPSIIRLPGGRQGGRLSSRPHLR